MVVVVSKHILLLETHSTVMCSAPDLSDPVTNYKTMLQISKTIIQSSHTLMLSLHWHVMLNLMSLIISFWHTVSIHELQVHIDRTKASCRCRNILSWECLPTSHWMCWQLIKNANMQQIWRKWLDLGTCSRQEMKSLCVCCWYTYWFLITSRDYTGNCGEKLNMWSNMVQTWGVWEVDADLPDNMASHPRWP